VTPPPGKTSADTAPGAVDSVVRELPGPLRPTGGPADSRQIAPVAAPPTRTLQPVTGALPQAAAPTGTQRPAPADLPVTSAAATRTADIATAPRVKETGQAAGHRDVVVKAASVGKRHSIVTEKQPVAASAARPDSLGGTSPAGDGPAPLQVHLGALSGISTSASGAPTEGGSAAFLPAAVASGLVAFHQPRKATDVEARRHDAEAPTVSPD
jgi:hypothetical protein